ILTGLFGTNFDSAFAQTPNAPPPNFKVAFIGDQGLNGESEAVLQLIAIEDTDMVLHQGDFDYADNPTAWDNQINTFLPGIPYFASVGNHDVAQWPAYQQKLQDRLANIPGAVCTGDLGVKSSCHYQGLFFILSGVGTMGSGHESYIQNELAADNSVWSICSWHKNQNAMQVGSKSNEVGWGAYEACRQGGAIIATAHEHSYERTKTLISTQSQTVNPAWTNPNDVSVSEGSTFAFVSGLGGQSIRNQDRCTPTSYPYGCNGEWANIYTSNQGAQSGALFCEFNVDGQENKASCYFKNISGQTIDSFNITSFMGVEIPQEPPVAHNQSVSTFENNSIDITLSATDANGDPLTYSIISGPQNGSLSGTGQTQTYTPNPNYDGPDSFTFIANDGTADSNIATVSITVNPIPTSGTSLDQTVGLRFTNLNVPQGATITSAYIQFETDETDSIETSLILKAQDADDTSTFTSATNDITNRPTTTASVSWNSVIAWNTVNEKHSTPDISPLVQEVVDRP
ncbi:MAG: Ig-like domain-containing protein, partial [Nitrosopumilaceae archaeon]